MRKKRMSRLLFAGMLALMLCACSNTGKEKEEITVLEIGRAHV